MHTKDKASSHLQNWWSYCRGDAGRPLATFRRSKQHIRLNWL